MQKSPRGLNVEVCLLQADHAWLDDYIDYCYFCRLTKILFTITNSVDILIYMNVTCDMPVWQSLNSGVSPYFTVF